MNRRRMLKLMANCAIGSTLSSPRAFAETAASPQMTELSAYMSAARSRALPADVAEQAKHHLLDTLASIISGSRLAPGAAAQRYLGMYVGEWQRDDPRHHAHGAADRGRARQRRDGARGRDRRFAQCRSLSHPGCAVVPAALAMAEELGADGTILLRAVTLGYDIGTRVILAMFGAYAKASYDVSLATHSIAGTFGAARPRLAASPASMRSRCAGCSTTPRSNPLASRPGSATPITSRRRSCSPACRRATASRRHCSCGPAGPASTTSSRARTISSRLTRRRRSRERLVDKLGERYEIARTNIKKWTVGSPIQAPLDAHRDDPQQARRSRPIRSSE